MATIYTLIAFSCCLLFRKKSFLEVHGFVLEKAPYFPKSINLPFPIHQLTVSNIQHTTNKALLTFDSSKLHRNRFRRNFSNFPGKNLFLFAIVRGACASLRHLRDLTAHSHTIPTAHAIAHVHGVGISSSCHTVARSSTPS